MKLVKKGTLFKRPEIEVSEEEYQAYKLGLFFGRVEGFSWGISLMIVIATMIRLIFL